MARRFVGVLVAAAFVVTLLGPATVVASDDPAADAALPLGEGGDALAVERLRPTVAAPGPAKGSDRSTEVPVDPAPREASREDVLEQSTRAAVYERVHDAPGATLADIADAVGVTKSTVRYHVRVLREAGLVDATEAAGALRVAPADADVDLVASLNAPGTGAVLDAVAEHEPATVSSIASSSDRAPSTVSHHLSTLEERELVERERDGEAVVTTLTDATRRAIESDQPTPADD